MIDPLLLGDLIDGGWKKLDFQPFHPGVTIHPLYGSGDGPAAAILRYEENARVPYHEHTGFEHVLILDGSQSDERGRYDKGSLTINPPGTSHDVWSDEGCVALLIWERPVRIIASGPL
ncbi:cupin domain-containing protein [Flaviflagellibacter deserti]|uniref:Cupin domain-containing protein n=1 Tax=Flaviflagellibacter deserti TaxID=2267266 RepID=A0ABV9Z4L6_9HYPH